MDAAVRIRKNGRGILFVLVICGLGVLVTAESGEAMEGVYPGETWEERAAGEVGLDETKLKAMSRYVGGRGCVVRYGYMVYGWGEVKKRGDVASAAKVWYSHFLFMAVEDKKISSPDEKVSKWEPRLKEINKKLGYKDREISWKHLANQTSCYGVSERPGEAYDYNDWQMALFFDCLFLKVYGATFETVDKKVLGPLLTDILQCEDKPTFMAFGARNRAGRVAVSVRDFARFGLLYMREGKWKGKQLLSAKHARMAVRSALPNSIPQSKSFKKGQEAEMIAGQRSIGSTRIPDNQTDHMGSYSWLWWTNGVDRKGKRHWPDVPVDAYGAFGHGGPRAMIVIPSLDLILSWNDAKVRSREMENQALKLLVEAVVSRPKKSSGEGKKKSGNLGEFAKWSKIEIALTGPESKGRGNPNPFAIAVDGIFTAPSGKRYTVPGFYNGDDKGGLNGKVWKIRFSADEEGTWRFITQSENSQLRG